MADDDASAGGRGAGPGGLTPEEIARRRFEGVRRGVSEPEVRSFLREVAAQLADARTRERELETRISELEQHPAAAPTGELIDQVGEETARVLRSAQEAADEIRANAATRAEGTVEEAEQRASRLREEADRAFEERTRAADAAVAEKLQEAEQTAGEQARKAAQEAEAEVEAARTRGREMVTEARSVRERILADLGRRRSALESDIAQLEAARGRLVETSRVVRRTLADAVESLRPFEEIAVTAVPAPTEPEEPAADAEVLPVGDAAEAPSTGADEELGGTGERPEGEEEPSPTVEELFARIRADRQEAAEAAPAEADGSGSDAAELPSPGPGTPAPERARPGEDVRALVAGRDEALASVTEELMRRAKRALQNEQNDLLDRLRRGRGRRTGSEDLLVPLSTQVTAWADVLTSAVDQAYGAGRGSTSVRMPHRLVVGLAEGMVTPMRERLVSAIESVAGEPGAEREGELAARIGSRYREWRAQELEALVGDVLAAAHARGVYDAAPEGSRLRWIPAEPGKCPDAEDNALEPTRRGEPFPTGQPLPPAHPGCRCLLVIDGV